jgi:hypothetical protein
VTGPPVLKVQSRAGLSGRLPGAVPRRSGPPRNIGQLAVSVFPGAAAPDSCDSKTAAAVASTNGRMDLDLMRI